MGLPSCARWLSSGATVNSTAVRIPPTSSEPSSTVDEARWFAEEVQPHEPSLRAYLRRKYPSFSDVDDLVQDSFQKAFLALRMGSLTSVKGFLFRVARNSAVDILRRQKYISKTTVNELDGLHVLSSNADVVKNVCIRDELELISEAIVDLPGRCQEIVRFRLIHGMDYQSIAQNLGISEATVRVQLARGMKKCSEFLRARGVIEEEQS